DRTDPTDRNDHMDLTNRLDRTGRPGRTEPPGSGGTGSSGLGAPDPDGLLAQAAASAADRVADRELGRLVMRYWRLVPGDALACHTAGELLAATMAHRGLATRRLPGEPLLRVAESPADAGRTVIEIVTDDTPFLVESVTAALTSRGLTLHLLAHPVLVVDRGPLGELREVHPDIAPEDAGTEHLVESWMHLEIDRVRDEDVRTEVRATLTRVLSDVRE